MPNHAHTGLWLWCVSSHAHSHDTIVRWVGLAAPTVAQVLRTVSVQVDRIQQLEDELSRLAGYFAVRVLPARGGEDDATSPTSVEIDLCDNQCINKVTLSVHVTVPVAYPDRELVVDIQSCVGIQYAAAAPLTFVPCAAPRIIDSGWTAPWARGRDWVASTTELLDALLAVPVGPGHLTRLCDLTNRVLRASPR